MKKEPVVSEEQEDYYRVEFCHQERGVKGYLYLAKDLYDEVEATEIGELLISLHDSWWHQREYLKQSREQGLLIFH